MLRGCLSSAGIEMEGLDPSTSNGSGGAKKRSWMVSCRARASLW